MVTLQEFVQNILNYTRIHFLVEKTLKDIVLSTDPSVVLNYSPIPKEQFANTGMSIVESYQRSLNPEDMFGGASVNGSNYPIIQSFDITSIPDILGGDLTKIIPVENIFTSENVLSFSTLSSISNVNSYELSKVSLNTGVKQWNTFKVGSYFPLSVNVSNNLEQNRTKIEKINIPLNNSSKYSIIHLSPDRDCKYHHIQIDATLLSGEVALPVIFIILDNDVSKDGDAFEFKITFTNIDNTLSDVTEWPSVMFFNSYSTDKSVPNISEGKLKLEGIYSKNNTVRIDGVEYYYVKASDMPSSLPYLINNFSEDDYIFIAANEIQQKYFDNIGVSWGDDWSQSLQRIVYSNYGIGNKSSAVTYVNDNWFIFSETPAFTSGLQTALNSASYLYQKYDRDQLFKDNSLVETVNNTLQFTSGGYICGSFGSISSDFKALIDVTPTLLTPSTYGQGNGQGVPGSKPIQYRGETLPGPLNNVNNGLFSAFDITLSDISTQIVGFRYGHYDTKLALNLAITNNTITINIEGTNLSFTPYVISGAVTTFRVLFGMIFVNGLPYVRAIVAGYDTGLLLMNSDIVYGRNSPYSSFVASLYPDAYILSNWMPSFGINIYEANGNINDANVILSVGPLNGKHSLSDSELNDCFSVFNFSGTPNNVYPNTYFIGYSQDAYGSSYPIMLNPTQIKGYIGSVNSKSSSTYSKTNGQHTSSNTYRIGFICNKYKGPVNKIKTEYVLKDSSKNISNNISKIDPFPTPKTKTTEPITINTDTNGKIITTNIDSSSQVSVQYDNVDSQIFSKKYQSNKISIDDSDESVDGSFGWKIRTYYQMPNF